MGATIAGLVEDAATAAADRFVLLAPDRRPLIFPLARFAAHRFRSPTARDEFVSARTWVRCVLAGYTGTPPATLEFSYGPRGKPYLVGHDLEFSVAHSDGAVLIAVGPPSPLGVDLERLRPGGWEPAMARLVCIPGEISRIAAASDPDRAFLEIWTRKEAFVKASGEGLADRLRRVDLRDEPAMVDGMEIRTLHPRTDVVGAVACRPGTAFVWRAR